MTVSNTERALELDRDLWKWRAEDRAAKIKRQRERIAKLEQSVRDLRQTTDPRLAFPEPGWDSSARYLGSVVVFKQLGLRPWFWRVRRHDGGTVAMGNAFTRRGAWRAVRRENPKAAALEGSKR